MEIVEHHAFRVTRNADLEVEEDDDEDLLQALERELARRRFGPPVRLEVAADMAEHVLDLLVRELDVAGPEVYRLPGPLDLRGAATSSPTSTAPTCTTARSCRAPTPTSHRPRAPRPATSSRRSASGDVLVHHPYDSFSTRVQAFIEQAAADPHVLAIKQTLYRTSGDSPIVDALIDAAEAGKQVVALVEIKARFDEQANITWARKLEQAGVHVVYGLVGLKTHCKLCLVVRQEAEGLRRYCHVGTGNYNPKTARLYEDLGLLTADDAGRRGPHRPVQPADRLRAAQPVQAAARRAAAVRSGLIDRIDAEIEHEQRQPGSGHIADQGELHRRRAGHRRALPGLAGRRAGRAVGARHLRAAPRRARALREHRGALASSAASSSTRGSSSSAPAATPRSGSAAPT